ncbi:hypothetical protein PF011_g32389 [Phytophthora fragariae]|uniref:RxLR effector protein n=1 Tax=Phytophthora fragariae TaxID=53985 RepID=A0A6A3GI63_9STRA|nr:hypothetical protein PF011_g32389 [Phytophthora fragariae]KAE9267764.1 hypothetical protein PF008_g31285 [Phytophthora fragariae]
MGVTPVATFACCFGIFCLVSSVEPKSCPIQVADASWLSVLSSFEAPASGLTD